MKHFYSVLTLMSVALLSGSVATADDSPEERPDRAQFRERMIERFDADGDGQLSDSERTAAREEVGGRRGREGRPGPVGDPEQLFEMFDADGDDHLSREEFLELTKAVRKMRERFGAPGEGGPRDRGPREARGPRGDRPGPPREEDRPRRGPREKSGKEFDGDRFRPLQNQDSLQAEEGERNPRRRGRDAGRGDPGKDKQAKGDRQRGKPRGSEGGPMGPPDPEQVFQRFDANEDGQLSLDEFKQLAEEMRERRGRQGRGRGAFGPPGPPSEGELEGRPPRGKRRGRPGPDFGNLNPQPQPEPSADTPNAEQSV